MSKWITIEDTGKVLGVSDRVESGKRLCIG